MSKTPRSSRRAFLQGRAAVNALAAAADQLASETDENVKSEKRESYLIQVARDAMACEFQVLLNAGQHRLATEAAIEALDEVEKVEDQLTVYRSSSEVSLLNALAAAEPVQVAPNLLELLQTARQLSIETGGAFDVTAGPLTRVWGFHRREGKLPDEQAIRQALDTVGDRLIELDTESSTVRFRREGVETNFGGIGKGYALDRAGSILDRHAVTDFLVHGGNSSILARGSRLSGDDRAGWRVGLRHPLRPNQRLADLWLEDRALGTSGSANQYFHFAGKRYGHVIDPRSGYPADGVLSATVLAPTATLADAYSTAFFVMGLETTREFCREHPELGVLLATPGPRQGSVALHTCNLTDDIWESCETT